MSIEDGDRPHIERIKAQTDIGPNSISENEVTLFWEQGSIKYIREGNRAVTAIPNATLPNTTSVHKKAFAERAIEAMNQERKILDQIRRGEIIELDP